MPIHTYPPLKVKRRIEDDSEGHEPIYASLEKQGHDPKKITLRTLSPSNTLLFPHLLSLLSPRPLQPQPLQNLLRHILIMHHIAVNLLELNSMQTKQRNLDDENLKPQNHTLANIVTYMRRCFARMASCAALTEMFIVRGRVVTVGRTIVIRRMTAAGCLWCLWGVSGIVAALVAVVPAESREADLATMAA